MNYDKSRSKTRAIIDWLKAHGEGDGKCRHFSETKEPYQRFYAEWQDWTDLTKPGNREELYVAYCKEINGDVCHDPLLKLEISDCQITGVGYHNDLAGFHIPADPSFVEEFLEVALARHLQDKDKDETN